MPRANYKTCKACGGHTDAVGPLSHTCLCLPCSKERERQAIIQQVEHNGPVFQHWRTRIAASVGAVLLDEQRAAP